MKKCKGFWGAWAVAVVAILLVACGGDSSSGSGNEGHAAKEGDECSEDLQKARVFLKKTETYYVCVDGKLVPVDADKSSSSESSSNSSSSAKGESKASSSSSAKDESKTPSSSSSVKDSSVKEDSKSSSSIYLDLSGCEKEQEGSYIYMEEKPLNRSKNIAKTQHPRKASVFPPPVGKYKRFATSISVSASVESSLYSLRIISDIRDTIKTIWNNLHPGYTLPFPIWVLKVLFI